MHEATEARRTGKRRHRARSKRKQGARVATTRNATMTQRQTTITEFVVRKYREDKGSGQLIKQQKHEGVLRCFFQNPNGVCNHNDIIPRLWNSLRRRTYARNKPTHTAVSIYVDHVRRGEVGNMPTQPSGRPPGLTSNGPNERPPTEANNSANSCTAL